MYIINTSDGNFEKAEFFECNIQMNRAKGPNAVTSKFKICFKVSQNTFINRELCSKCKYCYWGQIVSWYYLSYWEFINQVLRQMYLYVYYTVMLLNHSLTQMKLNGREF